MAVQNATLPLSGQQIFVGIDVHYNSWNVSVFTEQSKLKPFVQKPDVEQLATHLKKKFPGAEFKLAYEAGFSGFWIAEEFARREMKCIIVHPADIPRADKDRRNKNDSVDSKSIASQLRSGTLREVWIPSKDTQSSRALLRLRSQLVRDSVRVKNRIHGHLKFFGISIPLELRKSKWSRRFMKWLEQCTFESATAKITLDRNISVLKNLNAEMSAITKDLRLQSETSSYHEAVVLIQTIRGIGWLSAITLVLELESMERFKSFDQLASYVGLVPGEHSSGDRKRMTRITPRCSGTLRRILIECSWRAVECDNELQRYHAKKCKTVKPNKAIVSVANRLLRRVRSVWSHRKAYTVILTTHPT